MNRIWNRTRLEKWLKENRPDLGLSEWNGRKGFYKLSEGQASSFAACGTTWKEVAQVVGAEQPKMQGDY